MKFEDRSHEETERRQRCARSKAWNQAKNICKLKEKYKAAFYVPTDEWVLPAASTKEPEEREFVVDSGASLHMVSKKDFNSAELETMRTSRTPTTVMTANGEVQTTEEATVHVKQLGLFVKVMLLETPAVLSLEKLCEDHGFSYRWISGQKPHLIRNGKRIDCIFRTMYHLSFLVYQRVLPQLHLHLLLHHLHQRIPYLMSTDTPKIQCKKEVDIRVQVFGETRCMNPKKPRTKIKMGNQKKCKEIYRMKCLDSLQEYSHLMNFQLSREQKWNRVRVSTVYKRTFRRTHIVRPA